MVNAANLVREIFCSIYLARKPNITEKQIYSDYLTSGKGYDIMPIKIKHGVIQKLGSLASIRTSAKFEI
jgi:hypothetical protein